MTNAVNVLEGLYAARASISPDRFDFSRWNSCTCGHIYGAAHGGLADGEGFICRRYEQGDLTRPMLVAVAEATGHADAQLLDDHDLRCAVSEATHELAEELAGHGLSERDDCEEFRNAAVLLLSTAIEKLEGEQQAALSAVKARDSQPVVGGVGR